MSGPRKPATPYTVSDITPVQLQGQVPSSSPGGGGAAGPTGPTGAVGPTGPTGPTYPIGPGCAFITAGLSLPLSGTLVDETPVPYNFAGTGWTITGDVVGSASVVVSHSSYTNYDMMTTLFTASVTGAKKNTASGLSFTLTAGDIIRFTGSGFSNFTRLNIALTGTPS